MKELGHRGAVTQEARPAIARGTGLGRAERSRVVEFCEIEENKTLAVGDSNLTVACADPATRVVPTAPATVSAEKNIALFPGMAVKAPMN